MQRKKIVPLFLIRTRDKNEEHKTILKQTLKTGSKNISFAVGESWKEGLNEAISFIK